MSTPSSNASYDADSESVSARSTMSIVSDEVNPTSDIEVSFYQKKTVVTGRQVPIKNPKRGQGPFVYQKTTRTEELVIQTTAGAPNIMLVNRDQSSDEDASAPAMPIPVAPAGAPGPIPIAPVGVPRLAAITRAGVLRSVPIAPAGVSRPVAVAPAGVFRPNPVTPISRLQAVRTPFFAPNRGGVPGPSRKRPRSIADPDHPGRRYILVSDGGGGSAKVRKVNPVVEREAISSADYAAIPPFERAGPPASPEVLVEDSDDEEDCTLDACCEECAEHSFSA